MEAVDALEKLVDKFVDCSKTQQWAREIKQQLLFVFHSEHAILWKA